MVRVRVRPLVRKRATVIVSMFVSKEFVQDCSCFVVPEFACAQEFGEATPSKILGYERWNYLSFKEHARAHAYQI